MLICGAFTNFINSPILTVAHKFGIILTKMFGMLANNYRNFNKLYLIFCLLMDLDSSRESETSIKCSGTRESASISYNCKSEFVYYFFYV